MSLLRPRRFVWLAPGALALTGLALLAVVRCARPGPPQAGGAVHVPGLHSQAIVARDRWGVPHLYAQDEHDLSAAQGYVTAQDRLWQMLLRRRAARGELSAWLGTRAAPADGVLSREDFSSQADDALPSLDAQTRAVLTAYTLGVNACLATCPDPPELALLKRQGKVEKIAPWTEADSLALTKMMQWAQTQQSFAELRTALSSRLGPARASELWPEGVELTGSTSLIDPTLRPALRLAGIPLLTGEGTAPFVAASAPALPAAWYVATLHSGQIASAGATWPGVPGMIVDRDTFIPDSAAGRSQAMALVEYLLALPPSGWLQTRVHGMLRQWDGDLTGKTRLGDASAAVYEAWLWYLARDTFQDELGLDLFVRYWDTGLAPQSLLRLAGRPDDPWWDDAATPQRETRDDMMRRAYAEALESLGRHYGDLHTIWEWDTMHAATFRHPLGDAAPLSWLLNRTVELGGDALFDPARPDDPLQPYALVIVSSFAIRHGASGQIEFALAGGQSGNPFSPHYADLLSLWAQGQYAPLQDALRWQDLKDIESVLVLMP